MNISELRDYEAFAAVVESRSLTAAAKRLGRSLQSVSRSLSNLESRLGATLVRRTTRHNELTDAGALLYRRVQTALSELSLGAAEARERSGKVGGSLRVGASTLFGAMCVTPAAVAFMERHPDVRVELKIDDAMAEPVAAGVDVALRIGDPGSVLLAARRLGQLRRVLVASPDYLSRRGSPQEPADLARHDGVVRAGVRHAEQWTLAHPDGRHEQVRIGGRFRSNSVMAVIQAVMAGAGVGIADLWQVRALIESGAVRRVLAPWGPPSVPLHALWPPSPRLSARVRAFVDHLAGRLSVDDLPSSFVFGDAGR